MDLADIKRAAQAAREFTHQIDGITFNLRVPTPHEVDCATAGSWGQRNTLALVVRSTRELTLLAVQGWSGLRVADVLGADHKHGTDELPFEPDAVALLLDERPDIADAIWKPLRERLEARAAAREVTAKN